MGINIQYITDTNGIQQAVVIPKKEWLAFGNKYKKLKKNSRFYWELKMHLTKPD